MLEAANEVSSGVINADSVFNTLKTIGCDWDAIVVAHQDEVGGVPSWAGLLDASVASSARPLTMAYHWTLLTLPQLHQSHIEKISLPYAQAHADLHIPYLIRPTREGLDEAVTAWATECGAELIDEYKRPADGERVMVYFNAEHGSGE